MRLSLIICIAATLGGLPISGVGAVTSYRFHPPQESTAPHRHESDWLLRVQSGSRSYMEGRGFQSYRRDRGFAGQRNFGSYPSARGSRREERPYSLKRRRIHGPTDSRCTGWARRCGQDTGDAPGDYESCMRYHGCR